MGFRAMSSTYLLFQSTNVKKATNVTAGIISANVTFFCFHASISHAGGASLLLTHVAGSYFGTQSAPFILPVQLTLCCKCSRSCPFLLS